MYGNEAECNKMEQQTKKPEVGLALESKNKLTIVQLEVPQNEYRTLKPIVFVICKIFILVVNAITGLVFDEPLLAILYGCGLGSTNAWRSRAQSS